MQLFKNAHFYHCAGDLPPMTPEQIEQAVQLLQFTPPGSQSVSAMGFEPVVEGGPFVLSFADQCVLFRLREDVKQVPAALVNRLTSEQVTEREQREGRKVGRKERAEIREDITFSLLPRAFPKTTTTYGWLDCSVTPWRVVVGASSDTKAGDFILMLRKALGSLPCVPTRVERPASSVMNGWVRDDTGPQGYGVADFAEVEDGESGKAKFSGFTVSGDDEVVGMLDDGFNVTSVGLYHGDAPFEFVLTHNLTMKKIKAEIEYDGEGDRLEHLQHCTNVLRLLLNDAFDSVIASMGGLAE